MPAPSLYWPDVVQQVHNTAWLAADLPLLFMVRHFDLLDLMLVPLYQIRVPAAAVRAGLPVLHRGEGLPAVLAEGNGRDRKSVV